MQSQVLVNLSTASVNNSVFSLRHNLLNFDSQPQIQFFDSHTLRYSEYLRLLF